jgi:hypothetical protein
MRGRPKEKTQGEAEWAEGHKRNDNDQRYVKGNGQIFRDSMQKEHPTTCFLTARRVRHYLALSLRSLNVEWGAFPVITEPRIKLPEEYQHQTESMATFSAPFCTKSVNLKANQQSSWTA